MGLIPSINSNTGIPPNPILHTHKDRKQNQTHGSVSAAKKTGKNRHRTQVCYLRAPCVMY